VGRKSMADERRAQIANAMYRCVCKYGLASSTVKKVAEEAGVKPGMLHHYYKDRTEIIEEVINNFVDQFDEQNLRNLDRYRGTELNLNSMVDMLFGSELIDADQLRFFYNCWAEAKLNPTIAKSFTRFYENIRKSVHNGITELGLTNDLTPMEARDLANMIVAIQDGVDLQWDMAKDNMNLKRMAKLTKDMISAYIDSKKKSK
jgi:TetR/AcrR family transcriptional regulator, transcriptional repressor of bet genes